MNPRQDMAGDLNQARDSDQNVSSVTSFPSMMTESRDTRRIQRRGTSEQVEGNASFRRTRSVGRLRNRVLRRTASSEGSFGILQAHSTGREIRSMSDSRRQREERTQINEDMPNNNGNVLENRSLYLEERRRRARSQSMALSSRSSVSSLGSFPAPDDIVESMPVRMYTKQEKIVNEDAAQCYICLVEYEEGERMRVLPCHHEFHLLCVDKWLKEVHRVCPLCRGNVCDASHTNHLGAS